MTRIDITPEIERRFGLIDNCVDLFEFDDFDELCTAISEYLESMED